MGKLVRLVLLIVVLGGVIVVYVRYRDQAPSADAPQAAPTRDAGQAPTRLEERYGFTSEGVGGG